MFLGPCMTQLGARKVQSSSTLRWPMAISLGNLWTTETWAPCLCVKICAVNHPSATWRLWRENVVSLFTVTARHSVCGCQPNTTNTCCNFLTSLMLTVFQSAVSHQVLKPRPTLQHRLRMSITLDLRVLLFCPKW